METKKHQHTPGPLEYVPERIDPKHGRIAGCYPKIRKDGLDIGGAYRIYDVRGQDAEAEANARLFAASPRLLEVCESTLAELVEWGDGEGETAEALREVIKLATGGAS